MAYLEDYINQFEVALYENPTSDDWKKYIDIESFARTFLVHNILANRDYNFFFSKKTSDTTSKLIMSPVWDMEWTIGIGWYYGDRPRPANYYCFVAWYFHEFLKKREFIEELQKQWTALKSRYTDLTGTINAKMDELAENINISQRLNFMRWDILNEQISAGGIPLGSYEAELECDKQFMINHIAWLDDAICNSFFINYDLNGGVLDTVNSTVFVSQMFPTFTLNNPTREGYTFAGWVGSGLTEPSKNVTVTDDKKGDKFFTATWHKSITLCNIELPELEYNGFAQIPMLSITDGDRTLAPYIDYAVFCNDNCTDIGEYAITIYGLGYYDGFVYTTFSIVEEIPTSVADISPDNNVKVWSYEKKIFIEGEAGSPYRIIDISGRLLQQSTTQSDHEEIILGRNTNGVVIITVANKSYKLKY